jgi:hypothetical protein
MCAFMPKYHWLPFLVWCISGSRSPLLFLVELGAAISVASTTVPLLSSRPLAASVALTVARICEAQVVSFEQVAKPQDGALVGQVVFPGIQPGELAEQRHVVQRLFHGRVREVEPLLHEVNAQHGLHGKRWASALGARSWCVRRDQGTSSAQGTTRFISSRNSRLRVLLVSGSGPGPLASWLGFSQRVSPSSTSSADLCRPSLTLTVASAIASEHAQAERPMREGIAHYSDAFNAAT